MEGWMEEGRKVGGHYHLPQRVPDRPGVGISGCGGHCLLILSWQRHLFPVPMHSRNKCHIVLKDRMVVKARSGDKTMFHWPSQRTEGQLESAKWYFWLLPIHTSVSFCLLCFCLRCFCLLCFWLLLSVSVSFPLSLFPFCFSYTFEVSLPLSDTHLRLSLDSLHYLFCTAVLLQLWQNIVY